MPRQDTVDFLTAFAVGTVLGIGATLLLKPERTPRERVARKLKPYRKQMQKSYKHLSRGMRDGSEATSELTAEVIGAGRELLGEFRAEVAEILDQARSELQDLMGDRAKSFGKAAGKAAKKTRRRVGI
jgi:gas vesicle protein